MKNSEILIPNAPNITPKGDHLNSHNKTLHWIHIWKITKEDMSTPATC